MSTQLIPESFRRKSKKVHGQIIFPNVSKVEKYCDLTSTILIIIDLTTSNLPQSFNSGENHKII